MPLGVVHTRAGDDVVLTRLDRFYVPTNEKHEDLLLSFQLRWDVLWSKTARDHATIIMDLNDATGEAGHQRHTVREDITAEPGVQSKLEELMDTAYDKGGKEWEKWERGHAAMRDYLLAETARRRTKDNLKKKEVKTMLVIMSKMIDKKGPTVASIQARKDLAEELYELEHPETKGGENLRQQVASAQLSDMSTKRFYRNYRAAAKQQWINEIKRADWEDGEEPVFSGRTTTPKQVPHELSKFWKMVFGEKTIDKAAMQDLLEGKPDEDGVRKGGLRAKAILRPSRDALEAEVTDMEVEGVMERLPLGKSAGPDRIPNGVYKNNPKFFGPKLGAVIRESVGRGRLPPSFMKGDISVLYKKGERDDPRNYRPITLLQNAYKVFTRIQAHRLKKVVHEFVSECQKGFVPHAFIAECSMLMNLVEAYMII